MGDEINDSAPLLRSFVIHKLSANACWKSRIFGENFSITRIFSDHLTEGVSRLEICSELVLLLLMKITSKTPIFGDKH